MTLSTEVSRLLEEISKQFGDEVIPEKDALYAYGGEPSTFNDLSEVDQLQVALITTASNRDQVVTQYNALVERYNEAVRVIQRYGNRRK